MYKSDDLKGYLVGQGGLRILWIENNRYEMFFIVKYSYQTNVLCCLYKISYIKYILFQYFCVIAHKNKSFFFNLSRILIK